MGTRIVAVAAAVAVLVIGCASTSEQVTTEPDHEPNPTSKRTGKLPTVDAEVGALNEAQVTSAFQKASDVMLGCLKRGADRLPYLSGAIKVYVRVDGAGRVKYTYLKRSTLGDLETERCMLDALRKQSWPAPVGGKEGYAENELTFDPPDRVRLPVSWSESDAGKNVAAMRGVLSDCAKSASSGKLSATIHVETDGSVLSVGVAGEEPGTEQASGCVEKGLKAIKLSSPGSFAAKLTIGP